MPIQKPGLPFQDHLLIGRDLYEIRNRLAEIAALLEKVYPKYKLKRIPGKAVESVDRLRWMLEDCISKEDHTAHTDSLAQVYLFGLKSAKEKVRSQNAGIPNRLGAFPNG